MPEELKKIKPVTLEDLTSRINSVEADKKKIEVAAKELLAQDKGESPEYKSLIDQHQQLRGHQRMLEGMSSNLVARAQKETTEKNKGLLKQGSDALDSLRQQMMDDDRRGR